MDLMKKRGTVHKGTSKKEYEQKYVYVYIYIYISGFGFSGASQKTLEW